MTKTTNSKGAATSSAASGLLKSLSKEEKIAYAVLAVILFLIWYIRSNFLGISFERDEGAYSYYGKMLLDGKLPYKDFYEQKLPGVFFFYAFIVSIFGSTVKSLHIAFTLLNMLTVIGLFAALKKMFSAGAAMVGAITYALVSMTAALSGFTIQSEHGVALFSVLGILCYTYSVKSSKWYWYLLSGLSFGAAFMVKTTGLFMMFWGGLILVLDFLFSAQKNWKQFFVHVALYCLGAFVVIGALVLIIVSKGTFTEMVFWVYNIPSYYVNRIPFEEGVKYFGYAKDAIVANHKFLWIHAVIAVFLVVLKQISWKMKFFVLSLAACSFMTIVPGYYFYGHYWIQMIPGVAMLSGIAFFYGTEILGSFLPKQKERIKYAYLVVFGLFCFSHIQKNKTYYFNPNYSLIMRQVYGNNPFPETMDIANFLNTKMKPEDQLAVFGSEPELFIYTNKTSPTRHIFFSTIVASIPEHKQFQREFVKDIETSKPKYFVFYRHSVSLLVQANTDQFVFEWANKYLAENYKVIGLVDMPDGQLNGTNVFDESVNTYQPKGQNLIYIFERKSN